MAKLSQQGQMVFDTMLLMHEQGNPDLERQDGGMRCAFRAGMSEHRGKPPFERKTQEYAAWCAGREVRRRRRKDGVVDEADRRKVRAIRMNDSRWAFLKYLGARWLEQKLDEEKLRLFGPAAENSQEKVS